MFQFPNQKLSKLQLANLGIAFVVFGGYPLLGSVATGLVGLAALIGLGLFISGNNRPKFNSTDKLVFGAIALFFFGEIVAGLIAGFSLGALEEAAENVAFVLALPLFVFLTVPRETLARCIPLFASVGAIAALVSAPIYPSGYDWNRLELGAGNPAVLALIVCFMYGICLVGFWNCQTKERYFILLGAFASAILIVLAGARIFWPLIPILPLLLIVFASATWKKALVAGLIAICVTGFIGVASYKFAPVVKFRIDRTISSIQRTENGDMNTPVGQRLVIWQSALELIPQKPLVGHGPDSVAENMRAQGLARGDAGFSFSHYHNAILNQMVRTGFVGTLAMLACLFVLPFVAIRRRLNKRLLFFSLALVTAYTVSGLTGKLFGHDILDSLFVSASVMILYAWGKDPNSKI